MEWLTGLNDAIGYIEEHLTDKIDYAQAARIARCSLSRFQRMFAFAADTTPAEYARSRRMSLAARELTQSGIRVIDLSAKYGYESPEAFTRAFQAFHDAPPSDVRRTGAFRDYPRLSIQISISGGDFNMGTKPLVRIEDHSAQRVVAFPVDCTGPEGAAFDLLREWVAQNITDYAARRTIGCAPKGHHPRGEQHSPNEGEGEHEYVAEMFLLGDEGKDGLFHGAEVRSAPQGLYLIGDVVLNEFHDDGNIDIGTSMQKSSQVMFECMRDMGGYELDLQSRPYYEEQVFPNEWFRGEGGLAGFKLWLPIRKAQ